MRVFRALFATLVLFPAAFAAELKVKVLDPQSAAVAGANALRQRRAERDFQRRNPPGDRQRRAGHEGETELLGGAHHGLALAPLEVAPQQTEITVTLRLAPTSETVVVSATRTPVEGETSGASVAALNPAQLNLIQPIAANDGVRFLPGVIVNTAGQRGGLSSIFVRGGESRYNKVIVDGVTVNEPGGTFDAGTLPLVQADRLELVRGTQSTLYGSDATVYFAQLAECAVAVVADSPTLGSNLQNHLFVHLGAVVRPPARHDPAMRRYVLACARISSRLGGTMEGDIFLAFMSSITAPVRA